MKKAFNYLIIAFIAISFGAKANNIEKKPAIDYKYDISTFITNDFVDIEKNYTSAVEKESSAEKLLGSGDCVVAVIGKYKDGRTFHESKNLNNPRGGTSAVECLDNIRAYLQGLESQGIQVIQYISAY